MMVLQVFFNKISLSLISDIGNVKPFCVPNADFQKSMQELVLEKSCPPWILKSKPVSIFQYGQWSYLMNQDIIIARIIFWMFRQISCFVLFFLFIIFQSLNLKVLALMLYITSQTLLGSFQQDLKRSLIVRLALKVCIA